MKDKETAAGTPAPASELGPDNLDLAGPDEDEDDDLDEYEDDDELDELEDDDELDELEDMGVDDLELDDDELDELEDDDELDGEA